MQHKIYIPEGLTSKNPYFYIIRHKHSGRLYAGSKWAKRSCNSNNLMNEDGYCTSSKYVWKLIKDCGLASFEIDRIRHFNSSAEALKYEIKFLRKVNAITNTKFINKCIGGSEFRLIGGVIGRKDSAETLKKKSEGNKGYKRTDKTKEILSKLVIGNRWWHYQSITKFCKECPGREWKLGRPKK